MILITASGVTTSRTRPRNDPTLGVCRSLRTDLVGSKARCAYRIAMTSALHQPLVLLLRGRLRAVGEQDRIVVRHPVDPAQPRVVQDRLIFEVEQALLVDRAGQDVEQWTLDQHDHLRPYVSALAGGHAAPIIGAAVPSAGSALGIRPAGAARLGLLESAITTIAARTMPPSRSASLAGSAGSRSPNSQVPSTRKKTLPVMFDTGPTIDTRLRCNPVSKISMPSAEQPTVT